MMSNRKENVSNRKENVSNRKENVHKQGSNSKNVRRIEISRNRCGPINLNATFANAPGPRSVMKNEMSIFVPLQPSVDYDLQSDIAYSHYLQAILLQQYASFHIKKHNLSLNDQLSKYSDILFKKQEAFDKSKEELKKYDINNIINEYINILEITLNKNIKELTPEVENRFHKMILILSQTYNNLYLMNIKPFESQTEYNNLQELLNKCDKVILKILNASGDNKKYQCLNDCLNDFENLQKELTMFEKYVKTHQAVINKLTLEAVSDKLHKNTLSSDPFNKR